MTDFTNWWAAYAWQGIGQGQLTQPAEGEFCRMYCLCKPQSSLGNLHQGSTRSNTTQAHISPPLPSARSGQVPSFSSQWKSEGKPSMEVSRTQVQTMVQNRKQETCKEEGPGEEMAQSFANLHPGWNCRPCG